MDLFGFALAVLLIELTPGPNMGWLVMLTLSEGRRSGLAAITGIALGLAANAAVSVIAASYILQQSDALARTIAILGAAMMGWLAWLAWREADGTTPVTIARQSTKRNALAGFTINVFNPKATLFFATVMPQFVADAQPSYSQGLTMAAISVAIATAIHSALVLGANQVRPLVLHPARAKLIRRGLAVGMLCVGAWFLLKAFA